MSVKPRLTRRKKAAVSVLALIAVCAAGIWLLAREATLVKAVNYLERRLDGRFSVADPRGSLLGKIHVRELRYEDKFGRLAITDAGLEWRPVRLLIGQIAVGAVSADMVRLELAKTEDEERKPPESLSAPLSFAVTDFTIDTLSIVQPEATHEIRGLRAAFTGNRKELKGEVKSLATQWGNIKGKIKIGASSPFSLDGSVEIAAPDPQHYSVATKLGGTLLNAEAAIDAKARKATAAAKLVVAPYDTQPLRKRFRPARVDAYGSRRQAERRRASPGGRGAQAERRIRVYERRARQHRRKETAVRAGVGHDAGHSE
jgi:autotransporter translocation and assembly factor TamB